MNRTKLDHIMDIFTDRQRSYGKVMFSHASVCPPGGGEYVQGVDTDPPYMGASGGESPPTPPPDMGYSQQAGGTHPTSMLSCYTFY